jgi:quercetin dioxygenase-like cupin family protein
VRVLSDGLEIFFVVEGTYELTVGDQTATAGPGTIVFIPRNVLHRFREGRTTTSRRSPTSPPATASRARR